MADEPTGNLDSATSEEIFTLLKQLSQEKLIIVVSHDKENAEQFGDRIIEMKDGVILEDRVLTSCIHGDSSATPLNGTQNVSKIGTKRKKTSIKQIFKFASRNMWRRKIRMIAAVVLCAVCFGLFGLSLSYTNYDVYKEYAPVLEEYRGGYATIIAKQPTEASKETPIIIPKEKVEKTLEYFGDSCMPIYTDGKKNFGVLTEKNISLFPNIVEGIVPERESVIPQNYKEVLLIYDGLSFNDWENAYRPTYERLCNNKEFDGIGEVRLNYTNNKKANKKYYSALAKKDIDLEYLDDPYFTEFMNTIRDEKN